jgi:hypothetical protein
VLQYPVGRRLAPVEADECPHAATAVAIATQYICASKPSP